MEAKQNKRRQRLIVYGHEHCAQAIVLAEALQRHQIDHEWRDIIRGPKQYKQKLRRLAGGNLSVPTVVLPDGTVMVEPWPGQVLERLGIQRKGWLQRIKERFLG